MVAEGTFREDLYYRLNVVGIQSQPLRDRRDEIPQMVQHFLAKYARGNSKGGTRIEPGCARALVRICVAGKRSRAGEYDSERNRAE